MRVCLFRHSRLKPAQGIPAERGLPKRPKGRSQTCPIRCRGRRARARSLACARSDPLADDPFERRRHGLAPTVRGPPRVDGLRGVRQGLPQCGAARRGGRSPAARGRQLRADPLPQPPAGAQPVPRRAVPAGPRAPRAVLLDAEPGAHRDAARARAGAVLRLHRAGQHRLRRARRPVHGPVPGAQRRAGEGHPGVRAVGLRHRRTPRERDPRGQRRPSPPGPAGRGHRARQRGRPAHQRPRRLAEARGDPGGGRRQPHGGQRGRPRLHQRHARQRQPHAGRRRSTTAAPSRSGTPR